LLYRYDPRTLIRDKAFKKLSMKEENLHKSHNKDHRFTIDPVDVHSDVQGKVYVNVKTDHSKLGRNAINVPNGARDPYALSTRSCRKIRENQKINVKKKNLLHFDQPSELTFPSKPRIMTGIQYLTGRPSGKFVED